MTLNADRLAALLREAADAHHKYEEATGKPDANWPEWYAQYIVRRLSEEAR